MRNIIGSAMVATMALSLSSAILLFGAVNFDLGAPAYLLGFFLAILWGFKLVTARAVSWKFAPTHWPVLAFVLYAVVRYFLSPLEYDSRLELLQILLYAVVYFAAANNFYHGRDRTVLIGVVAALAVFQSGYSIWQAASGSDMVLWLQRPDYYGGRGSGTYICPNHLAGFLEMALGLLIGRAAFFHGRRGISERDVLRKVFIIYISLMVLAGLVATFSRGGALAAVAGLIALLLWGEGRIRAGWQRVTFLSLLIMIALVAVLLVPKAWDRLNRMFLPDHTAGGRTLMWNATVHMIAESPVLGTGPGTWQWYHQLHRYPAMQIHPVYAHSDVLHLFSDYGLIGWLLVIWFLSCCFWQVALLTTRKTSSEQRSFAMAGSIAIIAILAHSWGDFNLHVPANALLFVVIIGFIAAIDDPKERYPRVTLGKLSKIPLGLSLVLLGAGGSWVFGKAALSAYYNGKGNDSKEILEWRIARAYYERAILADLGNPIPFLNLGEIYRLQSLWRVNPERRQERLDLAQRAVDYYEAALSRNPFLTEALVRMASAYELLEDHQASLKTLEQALRVDPLSAFVHQRIGLAYRKAGEEEKAAEAFLRAEELNITGDEISRFHLEEIRPRK